MKCTKQQQVLGSVMFVGLIAVGFDRLMPKSALAEAAAADLSELAVERTAATPAAAASVSHTRSFNRRLADAVTHCSRAAFDVGPAWQTAAQPAVAAMDLATDHFMAAHKLTGTVARGDRAGAIIDGKLCVIGQSVDGFKLVSVTGRNATLTNGHSRAVLNAVGR